MAILAHLEQRARRCIDDPLDATETRDLAAEQIGDEVLVLLQVVVDQQDLPANRRGVLETAEPDQRAVIGSGAPDDLVVTSADAYMTALREVERGALDVEASVAPVRLADPARGDLGQSTRSTSTRWSCDAPTARITVRSAPIVRPRRPITWPVSSSATRNSSTTASCSSTRVTDTAS